MAGTDAGGGSGGNVVDPEVIGSGGMTADAAAGSGGTGEGGAGGQGGTPTPIEDAAGPGGSGGAPAVDAVVDLAPVEDLRPAPKPDVVVMETAPEAPPPVSSLAMGLVSRWSLEEGAGTAAGDSVGQNPGTLNNGPVWIKPGFAAASKAALHFDGSDDFVELGVRGLPANNKAQTVAFWLRFAAGPGSNAGVAVSLTDGTNSSARLKMGLRGTTIAAWKSAGDDLVATPIPSVNVWHHYAYSFDGTSNHLYVDGVEKAKTTTAPDSSAVSNARIGAIYNNAENFSGDVDEVRIYSRAITAAEALALSKGEE